MKFIKDWLSLTMRIVTLFIIVMFLLSAGSAIYNFLESLSYPYGEISQIVFILLGASAGLALIINGVDNLQGRL